MKTILLAALAALVVAGCGGGGGGGELSKADLAKKANAICADYSKQGTSLGSPDLSDPAKAEDYIRKAQDLASKQQDELKALKPDSKVKPDYDKLLDATGQATDLLGQLADAAADKDQKKGAELVSKLTPLSADVDSAASAVGAKSCAS